MNTNLTDHFDVETRKTISWIQFRSAERMVRKFSDRRGICNAVQYLIGHLT